MQLREKKNFKEESIKILTNIASKPKSSLIEIKRLNQTEYLKKGLKMERESFYKLLNSLNKKEGISSFLNKRKPKFKD